jgi:hypothetical protein
MTKKAALKKPFHKTFLNEIFTGCAENLCSFFGVPQIAACAWQFVILMKKPRINMLMKLTPGC